MDAEHVSFKLRQDVIIEETVVCVSLRKPAEATNLRLTHTLLLTYLAEQIPLSCLSSWKFNSLPCDLHFSSADSGPRQASEESRSVGGFSGSQKLT